MPATLQTFLPLAVELRLPTLTLAGARALLGLHENLIKEQVDLGALVAWDIARRIEGKAGSCLVRRELRFLSASVRAWPQARAWSQAELAAQLYGPQKPFIAGSLRYRAWNCDSGHMINLLTDGALKPLQKTTWGRGRGRTPAITWESAIAFLAHRRVA